MKARITIEVADRKQAKAIELALQDPEIMAFAIVCCALSHVAEPVRGPMLNMVAASLDAR